MRRMRWLAVGAAAAVVLSGCANKAASTSGAAPAATVSGAPTVSIMVGGLSKQIYLPFMLTQRLGYFQAEGVNVSLQDEGAGVDATTQMMAGKVDGVGGFYDHTIDLQGLGQSAESVVSMLVTPG